MKKLFLPLCIVASLSGCDSESSNTSQQAASLKVGILPDTQADGVVVAEHAMRAVLDKHVENDVDIVIAVGDLVDKGTTTEFESWTAIAREYQDKGIEFLPLMGNHEESYSFTIDWVDYMSEFIPKDAVHQPKKEWINYYVKRENALFIQISYWELAFAFDWIKQVVAEHSDSVEHIFINSHDGLVGAKYGQTRELIVEGNKSDVRGEMLEEHWDEIRDFFYEHDIIWNQGHEHLYQRSVIKAPEYQVEPSGSTPTGGNYRLPVYTQVISGNASYKGYDFRYGERDYVQDIIQMKMSTLNNESSFNLDVNAAQFSIEGNRIRYQAFVAPHTILDNAEGPKELANPDWVLMDQFDRTTNRCEKVVDAITIKAMMETGDARPDGHDYTFRTIPCMDSNELYARILGGENTLFNRIQNVERVIGWDEQSRAEDPSALWARMHNYLYQDHEAWSPNFNAKERAINGDTDEEFKVPATSMDMKKLITLSWQAPTQSNMVSDILIVSGMTTHTGTYQDANGGELDIEIARGVRTTFDDWQKPSEEMPDNAIKNWDLSKQTSVPYAIEFDLPESETPETVSLAAKQEGAWAMLSSAECIVNVPYDDSYLETPPTPNEGCDDAALIVGYDRDQHAFWTIAHSDIELAIIK